MSTGTNDDVSKSQSRRNLIMTLSNLSAHAPTAYHLLRQVGLQRRRSRARRAASAAGWVGLGAVLGGGMALLLTPRSGPQMREQLGEQARKARDYVAPGHHGSSHDGPNAGPNARL